MELSEICAVELKDKGVTFKYLILTLEMKGEKKGILRGLNYQPYDSRANERIIGWTKEELEESGFFENGGDFTVDGGGSLTRNPYQQTITLFGANKIYGPEPDRQTAAQMVQEAFPAHQVFDITPHSDLDQKEG